MKQVLEKPGVLVVEDDANQAFLIQKLLENSFNIYIASGTAEAEMIMAREPQLKILLCDQQMPGELGLDYCRRLQERNSPLIRILVTGYVEENFLLEAINSQALFHYLVKPFDRETLRDVVRRANEYYEEQQRQIEKRIAFEESKVQHRGLLKRIGNAGQMIFGVGSMVLATILVLLVVSAVVGLILLLLLYLLKSFLGIDLFKDSHLSDWF